MPADTKARFGELLSVPLELAYRWYGRWLARAPQASVTTHVVNVTWLQPRQKPAKSPQLKSLDLSG